MSNTGLSFSGATAVTDIRRGDVRFTSKTYDRQTEHFEDISSRGKNCIERRNVFGKRIERKCRENIYQ